MVALIMGIVLLRRGVPTVIAGIRQIQGPFVTATGCKRGNQDQSEADYDKFSAHDFKIHSMPR